MKTDRELLDKAANVANKNGMKIIFDRAYGAHRDVTGWLPESNFNAAPFWNPLANDGDALRLAVKLHIDIEWECLQDEASMCAYRRSKEGSYFTAMESPNDYRRAIVRAASAIGEQM